MELATIVFTYSATVFGAALTVALVIFIIKEVW